MKERAYQDFRASGKAQSSASEGGGAGRPGRLREPYGQQCWARDRSRGLSVPETRNGDVDGSVWNRQTPDENGWGCGQEIRHVRG